MHYELGIFVDRSPHEIFDEVKGDFFMILSEIEGVQSRQTPYSSPVIMEKPAIQEKDDVNDIVFTWRGADSVSRNIQFVVDDLENISTSNYTLWGHAWLDVAESGQIVRHWQTQQVAIGDFLAYWSDRRERLTSLESAYKTLSKWGLEDLTLRSVLDSSVAVQS